MSISGNVQVLYSLGIWWSDKHFYLTILGVQPSSDVPLLTHASLQKAVEQLAHQVSTLQGLLLANDTEIKKICQKQ